MSNQILNLSKITPKNQKAILFKQQKGQDFIQREPMLRRAPSRIELKLEDKAEYDEYRKKRRRAKRRSARQADSATKTEGDGDISMDMSNNSMDNSMDGLTPPGASAARRAARIGL